MNDQALNRRRLLNLGIASIGLASLPSRVVGAQTSPARQYRFEGFKASAQLEATFRVPSIDFTFRTDPLEQSSCDFAVMGDEINGRYYEAVKP
jgi:hypothetical protein